MSETNGMESLDKLVAQIQASAKYADVSAELIGHIGAAELAKRTSLGEAVKATKNKLHQVGGMYLAERAPYDRWLEELRQAQTSEVSVPSASLPGSSKTPEVLRRIMRHHASTRERLPILDRFYATILGDLAPVHSVLDVACGLNPLAIPWMPLAPSATYHAVDIYEDMMRFLDAAFGALGVQGKAETRDVLRDCPTHQVDVALVLKAIPCLEQIDKAAGRRLMDTIRARCVVVSFPTRTVGGRNVGMSASYEAHFNDIIATKTWCVERFEFEGELVFRVTT